MCSLSPICCRNYCLPRIPGMCLSTRKGIVTYVNAVAINQASLFVVIGLTVGILFAPMYQFAERKFHVWPTSMNSTMLISTWDVRPPSDYGYPLQKEPLDSWACALIVVLVPWIVIGLFQIKLRSLWDFHAGCVGIAKAVISTFVLPAF